MSGRVGPIVLVLTGLLSASAQAQLLLGPVWESNITLKQDDLDLIHRTVGTQIHGKPVGTTCFLEQSGLRQRQDYRTREEIHERKSQLRAGGLYLDHD
jgi:hypothetical protein